MKLKFDCLFFYENYQLQAQGITRCLYHLESVIAPHHFLPNKFEDYFTNTPVIRPQHFQFSIKFNMIL